MKIKGDEKIFSYGHKEDFMEKEAFEWKLEGSEDLVEQILLGRGCMWAVWAN